MKNELCLGACLIILKAYFESKSSQNMYVFKCSGSLRWAELWSCDYGVKSSDQGQDTGVVTPEATGLLVTLQFSKHYITYMLPRHRKFSLFTKFSHFSCKCVYFLFHWVVNGTGSLTHQYFLFFLFLHIVSVVGVHLSEWNTEGKLGQYSLQLRQKRLSFKSPPHPHFPLKTFPANTAALPQPVAVYLRPALPG